MKRISFPIQTPRNKPKPTTATVYSKPVKQSNFFSFGLIAVLVLLVAGLYFATPQLQKVVTSWQQNTAKSSASTNQTQQTIRTVALKNRFNQPCIVEQTNSPASSFVELPQTLAWYKPQKNNCADTTFEAIRLVKGDVLDPNASQRYVGKDSLFTLLVYPEGNQPTNIDIVRYQTLLTGSFIARESIFDPSKSFQQKQTQSKVFYLDSTCRVSTSACDVWQLERSSGNLELLYTLAPSPIVPRFATTEPAQDTLTVVQTGSDPTTLSIIDLTINSSVFTRVLKNNDPTLQSY